MKFYQKGSEWIAKPYNNDGEISVKPGDYIRHVNGDRISIYATGASRFDILVSNIVVTNIEKNDVGDKYADMAEFIAKTKNFFKGEMKASKILESGSITYLGYAAKGEPTSGYWDIEKIEVSGSETTFTSATGAWDDVETLSYE